jgi:hypothetical protein
MGNHICEIKDCKEEAKYITTTESKMIEICKEHYNEKYKN